MEIAFVDVGQGDGAVLITPERDKDERIVVIDAGDSEHMLEFLITRFMAYRDGFRFHAAINTHPDEDHYFGFESIFRHEGKDKKQKIHFDKFYHSGIVERPEGVGWDKPGGTVKFNKRKYLNSLVQTHDEMIDIFSDYSGAKKFPKTISTAIKNELVAEFLMLSTEHDDLQHGSSWLPEFPPLGPRGYEIEILDPYIEKDAAGNKLLRTFASQPGKTKNGHSIILRLTYGDFSVLFGGDLNAPAEKFLLQKYAKINAWPKTTKTAKRWLMLFIHFFAPTL